MVEKTGYIEIRVVGRRGNLEISPDNYDIKEIMAVLQHAENLLFPGKGKDRPLISYQIKEGSVVNILTTALQFVIGFNAVLSTVQNSGNSIDFLETSTAKSIEFFQEAAKKQGVEYQISTSIENSSEIRISKDTLFVRTEEVWVDAEFYFYGTVIDFGGKQKANIHLDTKEAGTLIISADKDELREYESNPLYKSYGIRAIGKQSIQTGELDRSSLRLLEIIDYDRNYDEKYLSNLIKKGSESWKGISDADEWLSDLRY